VVGLYDRRLSPSKGFKDYQVGIESDYNRGIMESRRRQGKSLLSERTKARWATLAAINEGGYGMGDAYDAEEREEDLDMDMGDEPDMDMDMDDEPEMDMDLGDEPEMDMGDEGDDEEVVLSDEEVEAALPLLQKLVAAAEGMAGEGGEEDFGDELMEPMGDDDEDPEMDEMPDLEDEEDEEEDEELAENLSRLERLNVQVVDQNKIVKEVMKRVTKRLLKQL